MAVAAAAQDNSAAAGRMAGPTLGFAFDASLGSIRRLAGIPGAATVGDPIDAGFRLAAAVISPRQDSALTVSAADGQVSILGLGNGNATVAAIAGAMAAPDRLLYSPAGRAALLYQPSTRRLQAVTGLPDNAAVRELSLAGFVDPPTGMAISDDGAMVLVASGSEDDAPVWLLAADGTSVPLPVPGKLVAFRRDSHDALTAGANGDIYLVQDGSAAFRLIYTGNDATKDPAGVQFSADGARAYVASRGGSLTALDPATDLANTTSCGCSPVGLEPLGSGTLFRLNEMSGLPLWLLDGAAGTPRVWFIPAGQSRLDAARRSQ